MSTLLSVNLNKIALLRNSRGRDYPNLAHFGKRALKMGARGLTLHPRPDQRHGRYADIAVLKALVAEFEGTELNIEGNPVDSFMDAVLQTKPDQCTLVPDSPNQLTSDHGYDLDQDTEMLKPIIGRLKEQGIRVSIFMDPIAENMAKAKRAGADRVELYTESWARAFGSDQEDYVYQQLEQATKAAVEAGLGVNAGHDLNLENLPRLLQIGQIDEVSIGHALIVEALDQGFDPVVSQYVKLTKTGGR